MRLTPEQLQALRDLISNHFTALVVNVVSPAAVSEETLYKLQLLGLVRPEMRSVEDAYLAGMVAEQLEGKGKTAYRSANQGKRLTVKRAKAHLKANPVPLSEAEVQAIKVAEMQAGQYLRGLGDRVNNQFGQRVLSTNNRALARAERYRGKVRDATARALENRKSVNELVSDLGHSTKDWTRDLHRVAATELQSAMNQGRIAEAVKKKGHDVKIFFIVHKNACDQCKRLLLEPNGIKPRIFTAAELAANGTNVGRKAKEWKAVQGTIHPSCFCVPQKLLDGLTLNAQGRMVPDDGQG